MTKQGPESAVEAIRLLFQDFDTVESAVLFGSVARGSAGPTSDIDVLVVIRNRRLGAVRKRLHDVEEEHDIEVSPVFVQRGQLKDLDPQFLDSILRDGIVLKGELPLATPLELGMKPVRIVSLDVSRLTPSKKMQLYRALDGYETHKRNGRKRYRASSLGFLGEVGGWRAGRGAIIVPDRALPRLEEILESYGARRNMVAAWLSPS